MIEWRVWVSWLEFMVAFKSPMVLNCALMQRKKNLKYRPQ